MDILSTLGRLGIQTFFWSVLFLPGSRHTVQHGVIKSRYLLKSDSITLSGVIFINFCNSVSILINICFLTRSAFDEVVRCHIAWNRRLYSLFGKRFVKMIDNRKSKKTLTSLYFGMSHDNDEI